MGRPPTQPLQPVVRVDLALISAHFTGGDFGGPHRTVEGRRLEDRIRADQVPQALVPAGLHGPTALDRSEELQGLEREAVLDAAWEPALFELGRGLAAEELDCRVTLPAV